jgi:diguanylate cyclase (GGDEF)-like protein/PAS domain S-box-containing protein
MTLKDKLVALIVSLFAVFIWSLAFFSATVLQNQLKQVLFDQQFSLARHIAAEIDNRLNEHLAGLVNAARFIPVDLSHRPVQEYLDRQGVLHGFFSAGIAVIALDGKAIADYPVAPGRRGNFYGDRDYFRGAVTTGKPFIDHPIIGRAMKRPVLTLSVPVFDGNGRVRAVMTGFIDLTDANFLGLMADRSLAGNGELFIFSPEDGVIIASTDPQRVMTVAPPRGVNLMLDSLTDGFEGSGIAFGADGVARLYSGKAVPLARWIVLAALPADIAFRPAAVMRQYLYAAAAVMTLLAVGLIGWTTRRTLAPLEAAGLAMRRMTGGQTTLTELPVGQDDEVGRLIASFNLLVHDRRDHEAALAQSEQRFRLLVEAAPDAIVVATGVAGGERFAYANTAALGLLGAASDADLLGRPVADRVQRDSHPALAARMQRLTAAGSAGPWPLEVRFLRVDGSTVDTEVSAVPLCHGNEDGVLIFVRDITERKLGDRAIRESEARFRFLFRHMLEGFAYHRMLFEDGRPRDYVYLDVNPAFERLTGLANVTGKRVSQVMPQLRESNPELLEICGRVASGCPPERFEAYVVPLGEWFSISVYSPEPGNFVTVFDTISERKRAEMAQGRLNRALRLLSDCNTALVHARDEQGLLDQVCRLVVDSGGYLMAWVGYAHAGPGTPVHPVSRAHAGTGTGSVSGGTDAGRTPGRPEFPASRDTAPGEGPASMAIKSGVIQVDTSVRGHADLECRATIAFPLAGEQGVSGALSIHSMEPDPFIDDEVRLLQKLANDLSFGIQMLRVRRQREEAEAKLAFMANHDPLTGLPNRRLLADRFAEAMTRAGRQNSGVALLFIDIDHFKEVNDSLGHHVGDRLLAGFGERLSASIGATGTVCRQGGDEFIILLNDIREPSQAGRAAQGVIDALGEPFMVGDTILTTTVSIGISVNPADGSTFDALFRNADIALHHAKEGGRNTFHYFVPAMNVDTLARLQIHTNLRQALKQNEFLLHYQPQIDLASGRMVGVEALLRWQRPGEELIAPGDFIPAAEQSGQIIPIGDWVLGEACRQAKAWQDEGLPPLIVAVNLSVVQFKRGNIVDMVAGALDRSGLAARWLELELTESILLEDTEGAISVLHTLKDMGVRLSIDDFGTGYSSLAYLKRLAVDKLKIDRSFIRNIASDSGDSAIVKAIIDLGHTLRLAVVAEGVETPQQLAFLKRHRCDQVQGFLYSRPVPAADLPDVAAALRRDNDISMVVLSAD